MKKRKTWNRLKIHLILKTKKSGEKRKQGKNKIVAAKIVKIDIGFDFEKIQSQNN